MKQADLQIADKVIANQLYLLRFTAAEKKKAFNVFMQMQIELKAKLLNGLSDYGKTRVRELLAQCTGIINTYYSDLQTQLDLPGIAKHEVTVTTGAMATIGLEASLPTAAIIKAMLSETLLQGAPLSAWWAKQAEDTAFKFSAQVRQGVVQGETLQQIITRIVGSEKKGITGIMDVSRRNASTLVHDSIMQISNDAKLATFQENADILNGVQQLSTLDSKTSEICIAYSGAQWDLEGNPINGTSLPFDGGCPRHPNCRSTLVPITKTYRELGINVDEAKGTRASDLGQIPADTSFSSFLDRHSKEYQDELLGKGKAEMWRDGKITLRDLVSQNGRPLTLAQLQAAA
jgi:hypothetical protein